MSSSNITSDYPKYDYPIQAKEERRLSEILFYVPCKRGREVPTTSTYSDSIIKYYQRPQLLHIKVYLRHSDV
jgi:hypothetical protein